MVETINQTLRRAIGKQSLWDKEPFQSAIPMARRSKADAIWWLGVIPLSHTLCLHLGAGAVDLPATSSRNLWQSMAGQLTRNQSIFLIAASIAFFVEFMFARHLFCLTLALWDYFKAWLGWPTKSHGGRLRAPTGPRLRNLSVCLRSCVCPMRLQPRSVKRMMFACVQWSMHRRLFA